MTVIKHKEQRVGVFIDTQNLYHSARNLYNARVNFGAVLKEVVAGRKLVRAVAYVITTEAGEEKNFFEALTKLGIETKTKDLQIFHTGTQVEVASFGKSTSNKLREVADDFIDLSLNPKKYLIGMK